MDFRKLNKIGKPFELGSKIGEPFLDLAQFQSNFESIEEQILFFRGLTDDRYPSFYTVSHCENALGSSGDKDRSFFVANGFNPYFSGHDPLWVYGNQNPMLLNHYKDNFDDSIPKCIKRKIGAEGRCLTPEERLETYLEKGIVVKTTVAKIMSRPDYSMNYGQTDPIVEYTRTLSKIEKVDTVYEIPSAEHSGEPLFLLISLGLPVFRDPMNGIWLDYQSHTSECFSYVDKSMIRGNYQEFSELCINLKLREVQFI